MGAGGQQDGVAGAGGVDGPLNRFARLDDVQSADVDGMGRGRGGQGGEGGEGGGQGGGGGGGRGEVVDPSRGHEW